MQEGDYIDVKTVFQMTKQEFENFRSYLKFLGYTLLSSLGQYDVARGYVDIYGNAYIEACKGHTVHWSPFLLKPKEQLTLEEALRMAKLGELMTQQE